MNKSHKKAILSNHIGDVLLDINVNDNNNGSNIMPIYAAHYFFTVYTS